PVPDSTNDISWNPWRHPADVGQHAPPPQFGNHRDAYPIQNSERPNPYAVPGSSSVQVVAGFDRTLDQATVGEGSTSAREQPPHSAPPSVMDKQS
ncbi:hypothetical protein DXG01_015789, partial [Tephrocybe rancida]